ncbi:hypothetical protein, partial [Ralstonia pseudosolanacearum]|uniref:hypothetical protein n=1 Tax=Ralstonia pseudosolanacearum TaxID=1310165 RepID=UPI001E4ACC80
GKSRESTQSAGLFTALSVWTVARKRQLAAWRGGFMQQRLAKLIAASLMFLTACDRFVQIQVESSPVTNGRH